VKFGVVVFWDKRTCSMGGKGRSLRDICTEEFLPMYTVSCVTRPHYEQ